MTDPALIERITRSLAFMLRHQPERFDLEVDAYGFAHVDEVVRALNERLGEPVVMEDLLAAVESGDRRRYEIQGDKIRALYGHSIAVEPGSPSKPPETLFVAIPAQELERARRFGLRGGRRRFLHLAKTLEDAREAGRRAAREYAVLSIRALDAWEEGVNFYDRYSLWLAEEVPTHLLELEGTHDDGTDPVRHRGPDARAGESGRGGGRRRRSGGRGRRGRGRDDDEPGRGRRRGSWDEDETSTEETAAEGAPSFRGASGEDRDRDGGRDADGRDRRRRGGRGRGRRRREDDGPREVREPREPREEPRESREIRASRDPGPRRERRREEPVGSSRDELRPERPPATRRDERGRSAAAEATGFGAGLDAGGSREERAPRSEPPARPRRDREPEREPERDRERPPRGREAEERPAARAAREEERSPRPLEPASERSEKDGEAPPAFGAGL